MHYIEVLGHIKSVRTAILINFVTTVIHCKAEKRIVSAPMLADKLGKSRKCTAVCFKLCERLHAFGSRFVHHRVVIPVVDNIEIVLIAQNQLCRLSIYLLNCIAYKIVHIPLKIYL